MNSEAMRQGLKTFFGHTTFRPGQMEIMQYVIRKENALGILATGGGKSLCYQLPALLMPHMTVVVSPLISLMADQVRQLRSRGIRGVEYINSSLSMQEHNWKLNQVRQGNVKILYVSPEKLQQESFMKQLATMKVSLFVVDEAHCISQWGHDFRTDYQRLSQHIERLGSPPVLALTATATAEVQNDICRQLAIPGSNIVLQSVNRENICFDVQYVADEQAKAGAMLEKIKRLQGPGLVYFRSRNAAERACETARQENVPRCAYYHGGMPAEERLLLQQQFLNGELDIIFATNAFGMGIDKPDIRFVIHYHLPPDMESYLQEVGRIGRNGERDMRACFLLQMTACCLDS
ncbi:RecQ family ATP-dependent DNA helicase [Aneurinibacillus tyrosinisolvens]|uniref:RecQ family ATP-dependent DNA helicase n=1 Tax=Aneurinibacillus tyrosinisolvens TaxID=1443435 RepID=UPI000699EE7C|nr:ATP-dependent DNA helicase RecQ [Aneurinibacillus tyrosinisolvens]